MEENSLGEHATALQRAQCQEKKNAHYCKVQLWQEMQVLYIPAVNTLQIQDSNSGSFYASSDTAVSLELLLPSDIGNRIPWDN